METAVGRSHILFINTLNGIRNPIGIEAGSGADYGMNGIVDGVHHRKVDNEVVVATR